VSKILDECGFGRVSTNAGKFRFKLLSNFVNGPRVKIDVTLNIYQPYFGKKKNGEG